MECIDVPTWDIESNIFLRLYMYQMKKFKMGLWCRIIYRYRISFFGKIYVDPPPRWYSSRKDCPNTSSLRQCVSALQKHREIRYFTTLIINSGGPIETAFVHSFWAPGHGKGTYDGIGGTFKNKIHCVNQSSKTPGVHIPGPDSGYTNNVKDVFDALVDFSNWTMVDIINSQVRIKSNKHLSFILVSLEL